MARDLPLPGRTVDVEDDDTLFRFLSEHTSDVVLRASPAGRILYISPAIRRLGYEPEDLVGCTPQDLVHPEDLPRFLKNTADLLRGRPPHPSDDRQYRIRTAAGEWIWAEGNPRVVRDPSGQPIEMVNVFRDVTWRREQEARLKEHAELFEMTFLHAGVGKALVGLDGRFVRVNEAFCRIADRGRDEMLALDFQTITHPDDLEADLSLLRDLHAGAIGGYEMDKRYIRRDGRVAWVHLTVTLARDAAGEPRHYIAEVQDITARQEAEAALKESEARCRAMAVDAMAATEAKSRFLANMSHELRTPLTAILGFTRLLAERAELDETARHQLSRIAGAGRSLQAVLTDLIDVSRIESGEFAVTTRPTRLAQECEETVETFRGEAEAKGLELSFTTRGQIPELVSLDGERLRQVLTHLLGNAVKFTESGAVRVTLSFEQEVAEVRVDDTGPGLSGVEQSKLFQRFTQLDDSSTRRHGGAGLGLYICRGVASAMGGAIGVESAPGRGSCFWVRAPASILVALPEAESSGPVAGVRVLVADDSAANRELARMLLSAMGAEVFQAVDGEAALEAAARHPVDVVLMDLHMPRMGGVEALQRLRRTPGPNRDAPVLAFTANAALGCGQEPGIELFDGVVAKPIEPAELCRAIAAATDWNRNDVEATLAAFR